MKKTLSIIAITIIAFSCKSKTENAMVKEVKQDLTDTAFKEGLQIKIYNCDLIKVDTINENYFDTTFLTSYWWGKWDDNRDDFDNHTVDGATFSFLDSTYMDMIDTLNYWGKTRKNPKNIFVAKFYVKASLSNNNVSKNILDTIPYFFDSDLKMIPGYHNKDYALYLK